MRWGKIRTRRHTIAAIIAGIIIIWLAALPCLGADLPITGRLITPAPDFTVHRISSGVPGPTALIVGGIQGDEPGGFNAAALVVTHYRITKGQVIVVPNLNFPSIVRRSRGIHGDMNRKFDALAADDPEHEAVSRIQKMIAGPEVDFVLNLHDGSGFYRPTHENRLCNPDRWGQSIIIDQALMPQSADTDALFPDLHKAAARCTRDVNRQLQHPDHRVRVKNTLTAKGNREMAKTLTFFAIRHHKPAFGLEASKSFETPTRVFYHLLAVESFLAQAGIGFERGFDLTGPGIRRAMDQDIALKMGKVLLMAENIRSQVNYVPMEKGKAMEFHVNHPLLTLVPQGSGFSLFHGNRRLTRLYPQYFESDPGLDRIEMVVDGQSRTVTFGSSIQVREQFLVRDIPEHRVNIIGFSKKNVANESGVLVRLEQIAKRFSMDRDGRIFRVEVYGSGRFNGMVLVDFRPGTLNLARSEAQ